MLVALRRFRKWTEDLRRREDQLVIVLSIVIGITVGLTVVAFIVLTGRLAGRMYPPGSPAWRRIFIPTGGALLTGWLLYKFFPNARGSGIPQTKFALFINDGYISLRTVIGKFLCCSTSLASGIALGREGPSVHIGAGIASVLGRRLGVSTESVKALIPVGCAAALAAAFNTPIAGVLFALEEILGDLHAPVLGSVVISSATSWMVLHIVLGDEPLFHVPAYKLVHPAEFAIYAVLGVAGGFASLAFVKLLLRLRLWYAKLPAKRAWLYPATGGLLVGLLGWYMPEVLGVGYGYVDQILNGNFQLYAVVMLAVLKIVATAACYSSGNAGGIFGPSLFIGAMVGGAVGHIAHATFPAWTAGPGAYALVGMGAAFAGIIRTPITSVIMIFELTRDYSVIVPLMIANLVSFFISQHFQREPIYEALGLQDGVFLPTGESREELTGVRVGEVMESSRKALSSGMAASTARQRLEEWGRNAWPVGDEGWLSGVITERQLDAASSDLKLEDIIQSATYPYVHPDHPVSFALERMGAAGMDTLPVVSRADLRKMLGVITLPGILNAYGVLSTHANGDSPRA